MHPNGHSEEFWFGPDMSIELYLLVNTLSIKGWNYRNCFQLVHYVAIPITPTPLTQRKNGLQGENPSPLLKELPQMRPTAFYTLFPQCKQPFRAPQAGTSLNNEAMGNAKDLRSKGLHVLPVSKHVPVAALTWAHSVHTGWLVQSQSDAEGMHSPPRPGIYWQKLHLIYINCLKVAEVSTAQLITCKMTLEAFKAGFLNPFLKYAFNQWS